MQKHFRLKNLSLKWKSIIILSILTILPIVSVSVMFFYQSNNIHQQQVVDTSYRNLNVMTSNFESVIQDVEDISEYIIFSDEFHRYMTLSADNISQGEINQLNDSLQGFFTFHLSNKPYFNSVTVEGSNGLTVNKGEVVQNSEQKWMNQAKALNGSILWTPPYQITTGWPSESTRVLSLFRVINSKINPTDAIGEVKIRLNERELFKFIRNEAIDENHELYLLRENGVIASHKNEDRIGTVVDDSFINKITDTEGEIFQHSLNGEQSHVISEKVEDFYLVSVVKEKFVLEELSDIRNTMQSIVIATIILGFTAIIGFFITILKPILELIRETKRVEKGDFKARVKVRSNDEIGKLGSRFNQMVSKVQFLIDTKYKLELRKKESEMKALQSQINPHFLYNTLDMIRWSARMERAPETGKSIEDLSRIFRISLNDGKLWTSLREELKNVQSYLELQKRRLGGNLSFSIFTEAGVEDALVMKIILQPLVENSIKHGFTGHHKGNSIYIRAYQYNKNELIIDVIDNGKGVDIKKINALSTYETDEQDGFALKNIHERITKAFGPSYGLEAIEHPQGTFIRLRSPFIYGEEHLNLLLEGEKRDEEY
ncbi:sensor histidine kinase [Salibacterium salarium]|uniref:Sensor histidine kinase n=1 Tax=Salibacterium salarium TaxID=284579 RepID=A0A428N5E7_9BACI|nr:sensor histidine kinase [Salibacterium salarium]RSL33538.1 sensor histidine kinase [Salibacterium salarium]